MSTRERWIVYPLLFLAIGLALRDKVWTPHRCGGAEMSLRAGEIDAGVIRCGKLQVVDAAMRRVETAQLECRNLIVAGPNGQPAIHAHADPKTRGGTVETFSADGQPLVVLKSTQSGGLVATLNRAQMISGLVGGVIARSRIKPPEAAAEDSEKKGASEEDTADRERQSDEEDMPAAGDLKEKPAESAPEKEAPKEGPIEPVDDGRGA